MSSHNPNPWNARQISIAVAIAAIAVTLAAGTAWAVPGYDDPPPGPDPQFCGMVCSGNNDCANSCRGAGGAWTTCGEYAGNPANDLDGDGVANGPDNCNCTPNPSQANCDGDSAGDACDGVDNSWYFHQFSIDTCYVDLDNHVFYETAEMYNKEVWKSACTNASCVRNRLSYDFNCYPDVDFQCCWNKAEWRPDCYLAFGSDNCGTPKCNF